MPSVAQKCVPTDARKLAQAGDGRALLAIPDARRDVPRLIAGRPMSRYDDHIPAAQLGSRKAVAAAKAIVAARQQRRAERAVAEAARDGNPGRITKLAAERRSRRAEELRGEIEIQLDGPLNRYYRCATSRWAGGETTNRVTLSEEPKAEGDTCREWSRNGKWSGQSLTRRVNVSPRWLSDVQGRDLAVVDGMVTTHADPIESPDPSIELYAAAWIRQGRGMEVRSVSGVIARHTASGTTYHSPDAGPKKAVAGLRRKMNAQGVPPGVRDARRRIAAERRAAVQAAGIARLVDRLAKWDFGDIQHVVVERSHSLRAGNCEEGTDQFISRFFPDRAEPRATVGEIAARIGTLDPSLLRGADLTLGRQLAAAVLVAIRKDGQARRALAI